MKVSAKWLVIILLIFGGVLVSQYWAGAQWRAQQGPDLLVADHQGNLYISLHSKIFRYSPTGQYIDQRDLLQLGIETRIGGIGFFPNGDLLMVPQNYQPSFLQNLLMSYRITAQVRKAVSGSSGHLSRCQWKTMVCTPLPELNRSFGDAFWVDIDENENIFLADTSQHKIYWLDKDGRELDSFQSASALQFPNQIKRINNQLLIANCNDNSLSILSIENNKFSAQMERFPLKDLRLPERHRWPIGVVSMGEDYAVLAKGDNLMHGSIVKMDRTGKISGIFSGSLGNQAPAVDFISLLWFNGELLAADYASLSIKRISEYGELKGTFSAPEFEAAAAGFRRNMIFYQMLERYFTWIFWSLLVVGFALAAYLEKRHKAGVQQDDSIQVANSHFAPQLNDKRIQWLEYPFFLRHLNKWLIWFWAPLILLVAPSLFSAEEESIWRTACWLVMHGVVLLELISSHRLTRRQLGALVPWVYIKSGRHIECVNEQNIYSYQWLGRVVLMVGREDILVVQRANKPIVEGALAQEYVMRLIGKARIMSFWERLGWLVEHKLASLVWQFLLVLLYILALLMPLLAAR